MDSKFVKAFLLAFEGDEAASSVKALASHAAKGDFASLRYEFHSLLVIPVRGVYVPPYESCYRGRSESDYGNLWGSVTVEVLDAYRQAGFEVEYAGPYVFAPDHIGLELAFMSNLFDAELGCKVSNGMEEAERLEAIRRPFLEDHLSAWVDAYANDVVMSPASNLYEHVVNVTRRVVHLNVG